jgi:dienelactone hydrolase
MKQRIKPLATILVAIFLLALVDGNLSAAEKPSRNDQLLAEYFRAETATLADQCLADIRSLDEWKTRRPEYRRQLQEMLGLWPMPERTELKAVTTGKLERDDFVVENLHFQASPGLYVTANLYLPKGLKKPAPAILYVCGHSQQITNNLSFGNKTGYQHHGEWFARNGYVCLVIDTLQLGEIPGLHHGTHHLGLWWWNARGYTPAGVEAWFGIRALDYLGSRPEVDGERIGITGRSGGGSYSWTIAALDDRVKVAAPVAGITDLQNQVVDGVVDGHCDCMFFVNTYRWDFPQVAALIAPRPLLIGNSDKDKIFPLDGVVRLHEKTRKIYALYGATDKLGLLITEGPHLDTQDLQVPVFRWFNRFLKGDEAHVEMAAKKLLEREQLKVFGNLPANAVNTNIQETFVALAKPAQLRGTTGGGDQPSESLIAALREKVFAGWPAETNSLAIELMGHNERFGVRMNAYDFQSQPKVGLWLYIFQRAKGKKPDAVTLAVLDEENWKVCLATFDPWLGTGEQSQTYESKPLIGGGRGLVSLRREVEAGKITLVLFAPRGIGPEAWKGEEKKRTQIRRRFMLLGQTLDGMRVWDIRRAVQSMRAIKETKTKPLIVEASGQMGVNVLYASLFEPGVRRLELKRLPASHAEGPDYLNVLQVLDIPQAVQLAAERTEVKLH